MSTSYYCKHIPTEREQVHLSALLEARKYQELKKQLDDLIQPYHIGSDSYGWQFCFQANDEKVNPGNRNTWDPISLVPWEANKESIMEYLSRKDIEIYNEYGTAYSFEDFWEKIVEPSLYNDENHINIEQYYKDHPQERHGYPHEFTSEDGLRFLTCWFE